MSWYHNSEHTTDAWQVDSQANCPLDEPAVAALCTRLLAAPRRVGQVNNNRSSLRDNIALQHRFAPADGLRLLWGTEWRYDHIESDFLFHDGRRPSQQEWRLFGNAEWRIAPEWLWNVGAMAEHIQDDRLRFAPRVFLNWQPHDNMTWRMGYSRAWRQPTLYERWANVQVSVEGLGVVNQRHTPNPDIRPQAADRHLGDRLPRQHAVGRPFSTCAHVFDKHIEDYIRRTPITLRNTLCTQRCAERRDRGQSVHDPSGHGRHPVGEHAWQDPPQRA